jgi:hypothetical protein
MEQNYFSVLLGGHIMQRAKRFAIIAGVVVGIIVVAGLVLAAIFHVLLDVLYVFLIFLAALMLIATALQIYSIVALIRTITTVRDEMKPLLSSVEETVGILRETAKTAGHTVSAIGSTAQMTTDLAVAPTVRAASAVIAGQQMLRIFLGRGQTGRRWDERRKQQMEAGAGVGGE